MLQLYFGFPVYTCSMSEQSYIMLHLNIAIMLPIDLTPGGFHLNGGYPESSIFIDGFSMKKTKHFWVPTWGEPCSSGRLLCRCFAWVPSLHLRSRSPASWCWRRRVGTGKMRGMLGDFIGKWWGNGGQRWVFWLISHLEGARTVNWQSNCSMWMGQVMGWVLWTSNETMTFMVAGQRVHICIHLQELLVVNHVYSILCMRHVMLVSKCFELLRDLAKADWAGEPYCWYHVL